MPVDTQHPDYIKASCEWELMRDSFEGERQIKACNVKYLPPTPGQIIDGMTALTVVPDKCPKSDNVGLVAYFNYLHRAHYPDFYKEGVRTVLGILNSKPALIQLPEQMEYLRNAATPDGQSLDTLLKKIHLEQLITGRIGLLVDFKPNVDPKPYIATYLTETIINWDAGEHSDGKHQLNLVVLDESGKTRDGFEWTDSKKWRVLRLASGEDRPTDEDGGEPHGDYSFATTNDNGLALSELPFKTAHIKGKGLSYIPFVVIGPCDLDPTPDKPPLDGLAELCLLIYRSEADYRFTLFMQGQETFVVIGGIQNRGTTPDGAEQPIRVGADSALTLAADGDAKYVGISSSGLPEQRQALEADRNRAAVKTGQLLQPGKSSMESGEALKTRIAAQTATLSSVATSGAAGLEKSLRTIAEWLGLDPNTVSVRPNLEFTNFHIQGQDLVQLVTAKRLGAPISAQTIHDVIKDRGLTHRTFDEEIDAIKKEPQELKDLLLQNQGDTGNNPTSSAGGPEASTRGQRQQTSAPRT